MRTIAELEELLTLTEDRQERVKLLLELDRLVKGSDLLRSESIAREAVRLASDIDDPVLLAKTYDALANTLWKAGEFVESQEYYFKSLEIFKTLGDWKGMTNAYCGLGIVHGNLNDVANALEFFEKGVQTAEKAGDEVMLAHCLGNIGHVYAKIDDQITALKYFARALAIDRQLGDPGLQGVSNMLGAIAGVMVFQGEYDGAIAKLEESLVIDERIGNRRGIAVTLLNLGIAHRKAGKLAEGISYMQRALSYAGKIHFRSLMPQIHQQMAEVYEMIGDLEESLHHLKLYNEYEVTENRMRLQRNAGRAL